MHFFFLVGPSETGSGFFFVFKGPQGTSESCHKPPDPAGGWPGTATDMQSDAVNTLDGKQEGDAVKARLPVGVFHVGTRPGRPLRATVTFST